MSAEEVKRYYARIYQDSRRKNSPEKVAINNMRCHAKKLKELGKGYNEIAEIIAELFE